MAALTFPGTVGRRTSLRVKTGGGVAIESTIFFRMISRISPPQNDL
jgi:hypothetical protein